MYKEMEGDSLSSYYNLLTLLQRVLPNPVKTSHRRLRLLLILLIISTPSKLQLLEFKT
jgi:hypothetical protein